MVMAGTRQTPKSSEISFETFFRENYTRLFQYVARRMPASGVEDVVSTTFVVAWKKFDHLQAPSLPWLLRIAGYEISNANRRFRREGSFATNGLQLEPVDDSTELFDGEGVKSALMSLSPSDQEILRLIHWDGLSRSEVAEVLDLTSNAVNVRHHRAMKRFEIAMDRSRVPSTPEGSKP